MEEPDPGVDLSTIETIHNLDTARMALRWALERIQALEKVKNENQADLKREAASIQALAAENAELKQSALLRADEARQRELYYAKMEEFVSLRLEGKLDLASLMKREADTAMFQQTLERKQVEVESGYARKHEELEKEYQRLKTGLETQARETALKAEQSLARRREALDQEFSPKLVEMHEMEFSLKQQAKALADRQAHFEGFYKKQRVALDHEIELFRAEVDDQVRFRLAAEQASLESRFAAKEDHWLRERTALLRETAELRQQAPRERDRVFELENRLAEAQQKLARAESVAQARLKESVDFSASRDAVEKERPMLLAELAEWKQKAAAGQPRLLELEKLLAQAQSQARSASDAAGLAAKWREELGAKQRELDVKHSEWAAAMRRQEKDFQDRLGELQGLREKLELERPGFIKELNEWRLKAEEQDQRAGVLESRLTSVANAPVEELRANWEAAANEAEARGARIADLENRLAQTEAETAARFQDQLVDLQNELARKEEYMTQVLAQVEDIQARAAEAMDPQSQANLALEAKAQALARQEADLQAQAEELTRLAESLSAPPDRPDGA